MEKKDLIELIDNFINQNGMWNAFREYIKEQGYTLEELGFDDD